jgi:hypothetical protein
VADVVLTPTAVSGAAVVLWTIKGEATTSITTPVVSARRPVHPNVATATAETAPAIADPGAE